MALEDLAEFFDVDEHAQAASYTPSGGSASSITVIFRNEFYLEDGGTVGVETTQPVITVQTSKVPGIAHGDVIAISGCKLQRHRYQTRRHWHKRNCA